MSQSKGKRVPAVTYKKMLSEISWSQFLAGAGMLLGLYYLGLLGWYYRQEMKQLLAGRAESLPPEPLADEGESADRFLSYEELKELVSQLHQGMLEEAGKHASKQDLLVRIKAILASCGGLRQPASRDAINRYLILQAEELCGVVFTEAELGKVWESLPAN